MGSNTPGNLRDSKVDMISTKANDMKQRRVVNAADAVDKQDYVTLNDLQTRLKPSAYTDTTNAANIGKGTLSPARLPKPTVNTLGGVKAVNQVANEYVQYIDTQGVPHLAGLPAGSAYSGPTNVFVATPSRNFGPIYQNPNNTVPLFIAISAGLALSGSNIGQLTAVIGPASAPGTSVAIIDSSTTTIVVEFMFFIVPPLWYYQVTQGTGFQSLNLWIEYQ